MYEWKPNDSLYTDDQREGIGAVNAWAEAHALRAQINAGESVRSRVR